MRSYVSGRNFNNPTSKYENQRITNSITRNPHISSWRDVGIGSDNKFYKSAEKNDGRKKRKKYIRNGGSFIFLCHLIIVVAMCILTLNAVNIFQQQASVEIVNLVNLPYSIKLIMNECGNLAVQIITSCLLIEITSLYFSKARANFLDIMSLILFMILGYLKWKNNSAVERIFYELALTSMTSVVTFANLVLPKLPKHKTKPNSIMSAFHVDSPSSQCESMFEYSDTVEDEKMDVDECNTETENAFVNRLKFRDTSRDDTPIREIRPLLNNFKFDNSDEGSRIKQKENVFSRSNLISNNKGYSKPLFSKPLYTRESYLESKENFYKSSTIPPLLKEKNCSNIVNEPGYCKIRKSYVFIGVVLLIVNTFYNLFSFYQQFRQNW
uniref:G_PROTEIN_RECEP_F1_2 domain-containing protein n=1 Tax=Strongyloides papillosus TaxID=174720 RepID=A0A0N5B6H3_STREA